MISYVPGPAFDLPATRRDEPKIAQSL